MGRTAKKRLRTEGWTRRSASSLVVTGMRFGRLVSVQEGVKYRKNGTPVKSWVCKCDCGKETIAEQVDLRTGNTRSCGCMMKEVLRDAARRNVAHGEARKRNWTRLYATWVRMKSRCKPSFIGRKHYFERGIRVCGEWKSSFETFRNYMEEFVGPHPGETFSLERINVNGNYEPGNVKWATSKEQSRNKTDNRYFEMDGVRKVLPDWARDLGVNLSTLRNRLRSGWTFKEAISVPIGVSRWNSKELRRVYCRHADDSRR